MRIEASAPKRRAPSLTPLIDVVFILLVFFMLVSRLVDWGRIDVTVSAAGGAAGSTEIEPAVVRVLPRTLTWQGERYSDVGTLATALAGRSDDAGAVYLDPAASTKLQRLVTVLEGLRRQGLDGVQLLNTGDGET